MLDNVRSTFKTLFPGKPTWTDKDIPDLSGKVFVVTGGPTGVGFQVTRYLIQANAKVYMAARSQSKIDDATKKLTSEFPNAKVDYLIVDLSDLPSIKPGVLKYLENENELHGLILNAGVMVPPVGSKTKQGYELQTGTNAIGHWLFAKLLGPVLASTAENAPANSVRVVWVSSLSHMQAPPKGGIDWDDINSEKHKDQDRVYGQSKTMNIYEAMIMGKQYPKVVSVSVHPGILNSELQRHMSKIRHSIVSMISYEPKYGAYTELYAALHPSLTTADSGKYFQPFEKEGRIRPDILAGGPQGDNVERLEKWLDNAVKDYS